MLEPGVHETVRTVVEHASRRVRRGVRRSSALDLQRAFIGDNPAQRPRRRAPRIDELARQRGRPGPVVQVPRARLESGRAVQRRMVILGPPAGCGWFSEAGLGVRSVSTRGGMFLACLVENGPHVGARLCVWRDAVIASHGTGPGVVGGDGKHGPELVGEAAQVGDDSHDSHPHHAWSMSTGPFYVNPVEVLTQAYEAWWLRQAI